jgi:hypothetical protein
LSPPVYAGPALRHKNRRNFWGNYRMNIVQRVTGMLMRPRPEWERVDHEPASTGGLIAGYAAILALLPLVGTVLAGLLFGGSLGASWFFVSAIVGYVVSLIVLFAMIFITKALAPNFGGIGSEAGAAKLLIFASTPIWVAGILNFLPGLNLLAMLAGFGFAAYLLYLGSGIVMKVPADKAVAFTAVVMVIWLLIGIVVGAVLTGIVLTVVFGAAAISGAGAMLR